MKKLNLFQKISIPSIVVMTLALSTNTSAQNKKEEKDTEKEKIEKEWSTTGNYIDSTRYIGTTNNFPLIFKTNKKEQMRLTPAGNLGLGITNPLERLEIFGNLKVSGMITADSINIRSNVFKADKITTARITTTDSLIHFGDSSLVMDVKNARIYNDGKGGGWMPLLGLGFGERTAAWALNSTAIGYKVQALSTATIVMGSGTDTKFLVNNIPNSLMVGFNSNIPTLFVSPASGAGTTGNVGIGTTNPTGKFQVGEGASKVVIGADGKVIIGEKSITAGTHANYKLAVDGKIVAKAVYVTLDNWADYVFKENYQLKPLSEVEKYITKNKHLPDVPSEQDIKKDGNNLGEMDAILLRKIEELTLYLIEMKKENEQIKAKLEKLER